MSPACTICNHPRRLEIDRELAQGKSHQGLARRFGADAQAVTRHAQNHLARQLVQAYERKELAESMDLLGRIEDILSKAQLIFQRNFDKKRDGLALKALGEQRSTIELLAKIAAYLHESRAMELQASRGDYESRRREEEKEYVNMALDRLNEAEADLWEALLEKIQGERHDDIVPPPDKDRLPDLK